MSYRTILVGLNEASQLRCLLASAIAVASRCDAHVVGLYVIPAVELRMSGGVAVPPVEDDRERVHFQALEAAVRSAFEEAIGEAGLKGNFHIIDALRPDIAPVVIEQTQQVDLVIIGHSSFASSRAMGADFTEAVLISSGRPTLVLPPSCRALVPDALALIGWNGSREAARAVFDSLPLLKLAKEVLIASVGAEAETTPRQERLGAGLMKTLLRHDVKARLFSIRSDQEAGRALLEGVASRGAGFLVMGAYGHARLREFILGGATRSVLREMTIPVVFSH